MQNAGGHVPPKPGSWRLDFGDSYTVTDKDPIKVDVSKPGVPFCEGARDSVTIFSRNSQTVSGVNARVSETELGHLRWHHLAH